MSTFTASEWTSGVRELHAGVMQKSSKITIAVTGTASSVVLLCKVPHGATIFDYIWSAIDGGTNNTWKLGLQLPLLDSTGSQSWTVTESALQTETANTGGAIYRPLIGKLPLRVSISDNVTQRWAWVIGVCTAAISASACQNFTLMYSQDDPKA